MAKAISEIQAEIQALEPSEKRELLGFLVAELDSPVEPGIDEAWLLESQRRFRELQDGIVKGVPGPEVFERLRARLG